MSPRYLLLLLVLISVKVHAESKLSNLTPAKSISTVSSQPIDKQIIKVATPIVVNATSPSPDDIRRQYDYGSSEWWLVYLSFALVLVTTGLAIYTAKLWRATNMLAQDAKDTATRQAVEMQASLLISKEAVSITKESVDLARKEFISSHRPRLIVRNVTIKPPYVEGIPYALGKPLQIEWAVVNTGDTPSKIVSGNASLLVIDHLFDARTPYSDEPDNMKGITLAPGGAYTFIMQDDRIVFENPSKWHCIINKEKILYFYGFITYQDDIGIERRTAFCRKYDPAVKKFVIVNDIDYEYND